MSKDNMDFDQIMREITFGKHCLEMGKKDYARYFFNIAYELTDLKSIKEMIDMAEK